MKALIRIARSSLFYLALIYSLMLLRVLVLQDPLPFRFSLCVICPILAGILRYLAEENKNRQAKGCAN